MTQDQIHDPASTQPRPHRGSDSAAATSTNRQRFHEHQRCCRLFSLDASMRSTQVAICRDGANLTVGGEKSPQESTSSEGCKCVALFTCAHVLHATDAADDKCNMRC
eukprot:jgi/Ulvmu1/1829/UM119_0048.1